MARYAKSAIFIAFAAAFYQFWLGYFLFTVLGIGRAVEPIENFPFICRRLVHKQLQACEDLWLDENGRVLYAACAGSVARGQWNQAMGRLNISGRRPEGSELMALYIDDNAQDGLFCMHKIAPIGYSGATGDGMLDLIGFDARVLEDAQLRLWLINQRPPVDEQGQSLDATKIGANATVEVFEHVRGGKTMKHIKTIAHSEIYSANAIAGLEDGSFFLSNDHSTKVGLRNQFDLIFGGGNIVYCPFKGPCKPATQQALKFANGITRGKDGLLYVAFSAEPFIGVYKLSEYGNLKEAHRIPTGMAADNLSVDSNGDIWVAGVPKVLELISTLDDPLTKLATNTILKIYRSGDGRYEVTKAIEDGEKKVLSSATTAIHDVRTGRLFIGGVATPFIMVCDPK